MSYYGVRQQIRFMEILFSLRWYVEFIFAEPDTILVVFIIFYKLFGGRTRLAMPKTTCALDSSSLKPGSGATKGVLDYGVSGQPDYILWSDYWTMKIQD